MSIAVPTRLTDRDLLRYLQCPHWIYWEVYGDPAKKTRGMEEREELIQARLVNEQKIAKKMYGRLSVVRGETLEVRAKKTERLMKKGAPVIYQGCLMADGLVAVPTLLVRKDQPSRVGEWSYEPVLVKRRHALRKEDHLQVGWQALALERVQGVLPTSGGVLGPDGELLASDPRDAEQEVKEVVEEMQRIVGGACPEPTLRKACLDTAPWGACCLELAERSHDIALLFQVNRRQREALRAVGIATVDQAATMDPGQLSGQDPRLTLKSLQAIQRQARSLEERAVIVRAPYKPVEKPYEIHFDLESYPPTDTDYLFGCLVRDRRKRVMKTKYKAFVAKRVSGERATWLRFLRWTERLPESYVVYHYSLFEQERMAVLAKRYHSEDHAGLRRFQAAMVDLSDVIKDHAVFPLYVYSLKELGKCVGATWTGDVSHGADSVQVYARWLRERREKDLADLIHYNEADVAATAHLLDWLERYAVHETIYHMPYPWSAAST